MKYYLRMNSRTAVIECTELDLAERVAAWAEDQVKRFGAPGAEPGEDTHVDVQVFKHVGEMSLVVLGGKQ